MVLDEVSLIKTNNRSSESAEEDRVARMRSLILLYASQNHDIHGHDKQDYYHTHRFYLLKLP